MWFLLLKRNYFHAPAVPKAFCKITFVLLSFSLCTHEYELFIHIIHYDNTKF